MRPSGTFWSSPFRRTRLWTNYGSEFPRRLVAFQPEADGAFRLTLPPGDYFVAATTGNLRAMWRGRGTLSRLAAGAERISLREGDAFTINPRMVIVR